MSGVVPGARARRTGIMYLTLWTVGIVGALLVAPRVEDPASVLAALLPTWAGTYLAWSAYRATRLRRSWRAAPPRSLTGLPTPYDGSGRPRH